MFSIDQNCHPFWDAVPKLQALAAHGHRVTHFIEDNDVAFTAMGASVDDTVLHLARERYHRSGGQDWGAALFYSQFLARLPVEIRHWEPLTGLKTKTLARQLDRTVDDLYDEFSPGDTWQLIGSSYIGDRDHHRVIGDLSVRETRDFLLELVAKAKADMFGAFPEKASQERLGEWFGAEEERLGRLLDQCAGAGLVELYRCWMREHLPSNLIELGEASTLFACDADPARLSLLCLFLSDYGRLVELYNASLEETGSDLHPLNAAEGELPLFAIQEFQGHLVRTEARLRDGEVHLGRLAFKVGSECRFPVNEMMQAGVRCLAGKAVLMVLQARYGPSGQPLALPRLGSLYVPAANRLAQKLAAEGLLAGELSPIVRVRFRLLDRMRSLDTVLRLPRHLAACFGRDEIPARELGDAHSELAREAARRLARLRDDASRGPLQSELFPGLVAGIQGIEERRRQMAQSSCTPEQMSDVWRQSKELQRQLLEATLRQIAVDWQVREIGYWDSRGALLPWSIALGGRDFCRRLIAEAEIHEEDAIPAHA